MFKLTESEVLGQFKSTGSRDLDVLAAKRAELIGQIKPVKMLSVLAMVLGVVLTIPIVTAILGIPMFLFGFWQRGRCKKNIALVEMVFARFTSSAHAQPAAAGIAMPQTSM